MWKGRADKLDDIDVRLGHFCAAVAVAETRDWYTEAAFPVVDKEESSMMGASCLRWSL